jgi:hypothetical protein
MKGNNIEFYAHKQGGHHPQNQTIPIQSQENLISFIHNRETCRIQLISVNTRPANTRLTLKLGRNQIDQPLWNRNIHAPAPITFVHHAAVIPVAEGA